MFCPNFVQINTGVGSNRPIVLPVDPPLVTIKLLLLLLLHLTGTFVSVAFVSFLTAAPYAFASVTASSVRATSAVVHSARRFCNNTRTKVIWQKTASRLHSPGGSNNLQLHVLVGRSTPESPLLLEVRKWTASNTLCH